MLTPPLSCRALAGELDEDSWVHQTDMDDWVAAASIPWLEFAQLSDSEEAGDLLDDVEDEPPEQCVLAPSDEVCAAGHRSMSPPSSVEAAANLDATGIPSKDELDQAGDSTSQIITSPTVLGPRLSIEMARRAFEPTAKHEGPGSPENSQDSTRKERPSIERSSLSAERFSIFGGRASTGERCASTGHRGSSGDLKHKFTDGVVTLADRESEEQGCSSQACPTDGQGHLDPDVDAAVPEAPSADASCSSPSSSEISVSNVPAVGIHKDYAASNGVELGATASCAAAEAGPVPLSAVDVIDEDAASWCSGDTEVLSGSEDDGETRTADISASTDTQSEHAPLKILESAHPSASSPAFSSEAGRLVPSLPPRRPSRHDIQGKATIVAAFENDENDSSIINNAPPPPSSPPPRSLLEMADDEDFLASLPKSINGRRKRRTERMRRSLALLNAGETAPHDPVQNGGLPSSTDGGTARSPEGLVSLSESVALPSCELLPSSKVSPPSASSPEPFATFSQPPPPSLTGPPQPTTPPRVIQPHLYPKRSQPPPNAPPPPPVAALASVAQLAVRQRTECLRRRSALFLKQAEHASRSPPKRTIAALAADGAGRLGGPPPPFRNNASTEEGFSGRPSVAGLAARFEHAAAAAPPPPPPMRPQSKLVDAIRSFDREARLHKVRRQSRRLSGLPPPSNKGPAVSSKSPGEPVETDHIACMLAKALLQRRAHARLDDTMDRGYTSDS